MISSSTPLNEVGQAAISNIIETLDKNKTTIAVSCIAVGTVIYCAKKLQSACDEAKDIILEKYAKKFEADMLKGMLLEGAKYIKEEDK